MTLLLKLLDSTKVLIAFCVAVGVVIFIHEFGHYIAARFCGLYAEAFSIGFGPAIIKRTDRHGTVLETFIVTSWWLCEIPRHP